MQNNWDLALYLLPKALISTLYMVFCSSFFALLIGLPLGIALTLFDKKGLKPSPFLYKTLSLLVNIGRSFPFAILMIALIPFTRMIVGTSLGTTASIVPLTIAAAPFIARQVESALTQVDPNIIEAAIVMGAKRKTVIAMMLLEALPNMISLLTLTVVHLIGYSAMAGLVGGGGLGQVAIQYGYQLFNPWIMTTTVLLLILLVQLTQAIGQLFEKSLLKKRGR